MSRPLMFSIILTLLIFCGCKNSQAPVRTPQEIEADYVTQLKLCGKDQRTCFTECVPEIQHLRIRDQSPRCLALSVAIAKEFLSYPSNVRGLKEEMVGSSDTGWRPDGDSPMENDDDSDECAVRWHGRTYKCGEMKK